MREPKKRARELIVLMVLVLQLMPILNVQQVAFARAFDDECSTQSQSSSSDTGTGGGDENSSSDLAANIQKAYSALSGVQQIKDVHLDAIHIAGILSNWSGESSVNPQVYEGSFLGKTDWATVMKYHDDPSKIYGGNWASLLNGNAAGYKAADGNLYMGLGLGQWTADRALGLKEFAGDWDASKIGDLTTQIAYMFTTDSGSIALEQYLNTSYSDATSAAAGFYSSWEMPGVTAPANHTSEASKIYDTIKNGKVDSEVASKVKDLINAHGGVFPSSDSGSVIGGNTDNAVSGGSSVSNTSCADNGKPDTSSAPDGTGSVPADVQALKYYTPDTLPASLKPYSYDPADAGLQWGGWTGWAEHSGQCAVFSESYMNLLYGLPSNTITVANGKDEANAWAARYGDKAEATPHAGSVAGIWNSSFTTLPQYGHTGVVQHVFANGDILMVEQNSPVSGDSAGKAGTWDWIVIPKSSYSDGFNFYKPKAEPNWNAAKK